MVIHNWTYETLHQENSAKLNLPYQPGSYIKVKKKYLSSFSHGDTDWVGKLKVELINGSILQARNEKGKVASIIDLKNPGYYNYINFYEYVISIGKEDAGKLV